MKLSAQRLLAYLTDAFALLVVAASAVSALTYAVLHRFETLQNLASSTLSGVGMAIGGCLGSALILRFKAARKFVKALVREINEKHE
jgi:4-hydroxybenzoate polyprenyltransferase